MAIDFSNYEWGKTYQHDQAEFERERDEMLAAGWRTPYSPLAPGEMRCCANTRGCIEWFCHPELAMFLVENGMIVNGLRADYVRLVGRWPGINALHIQSKFPDAGDEGFVDASLTAARAA